MSDIWILYQTTNLVNGKIYVGVHKLQNTSKSRKYLGSGYVLKPAIEKYERKNFTRITLAEFSCDKDAYAAEAEMVNIEFVKRLDTYNIIIGGAGGLEAKEETKVRISTANIGRKASPETRAKMSASRKGRIVTDETKAKIANALIGRNHTKETKAKIAAMGKGRKHTEKSITKMRESAKLRDKSKHHNNKAVVINGKYYENAKIVSKTEEIPYPTIVSRLKSSTTTWSEWRYATEEEKLLQDGG